MEEMPLPQSEDVDMKQVVWGETCPPPPTLLSSGGSKAASGRGAMQELSGQDILIRYRQNPGCIPVSCSVYKCFLRQQRKKNKKRSVNLKGMTQTLVQPHDPGEDAESFIMHAQS